MKTTLTTTTFRCDKCEKESEPTQEFPYKEGWIYLYKLNFQKKPSKINEETQLAKFDRIEDKDKHFCSYTCLESFIRMKVE